MGGFPVFIGDDKTGVFTNTNYTDGQTPRAKASFLDPATGKTWIFLRNNAATAIAAQLATRAITTDKTNGYCQVCSTTITANEWLFAGVRLTAATDLANTEWGWFQIGGSCTMTASSDTTTAELGVCTSNQSAGQVEAAADSAAGIRGTFGVAETSTASGDVVVILSFNVWGI